MLWKFIAIALVILFANPALASARLPGCISHYNTLRCYAKVAIGSDGKALVSNSPNGYGPAEWRRAYGAPGKNTPRVGVVVAYGDTNISEDIARFSAGFGISGLPACASGSQTACLDQRTEVGLSGTPGGDAGWATETALDVETIHGICPRCRIELVSAYSASTADLMAAVDQSAALGSSVVSMSWGGREFSGETGLEAHFIHPGVTFIASSGDNGYGTSWPAASPNIIAVGGTSLRFSGGINEQAWPGSGSGCSRFESKPAWQNDSGCKNRSIADISADADPQTGAAIYRGAWYRVGGTSLAAPIIAGYTATHGGLTTSHIYDFKRQLRDIVLGSNGTCSVSKVYLCRAGSGFDGPTGIGSPTAQFAW